MRKKSWNARHGWNGSTANNCEEILERKGIILKPEEELGETVKGAVSIGANNQPENPEYIGSTGTGCDLYHYFKDTDGRIYFLSSRTMQFDREMREARKRRKALRRMKK